MTKDTHKQLLDMIYFLPLVFLSLYLGKTIWDFVFFLFSIFFLRARWLAVSVGFESTLISGWELASYFFRRV